MAVVLLCGCTVDQQCRTAFDVRMQAVFRADSLQADSTYATYAIWDSITVTAPSRHNRDHLPFDLSRANRHALYHS